MIQGSLLGETPRIRWPDGTVYTSVSSFQSATGKGQNTVVAAPQSVNVAGNDFHLASGSPGINAGVVDAVYNTFLGQYGIDIRKAADGALRPPVGQIGDLGAS